MTVRIMRFTKLLLGLGLAACAWPLSGQNARQEIYADPDKAGGVYYAYTPQRAKGCSPLTILKQRSKHKKASAAPVGAIALTLFSLLHL